MSEHVTLDNIEQAIQAIANELAPIALRAGGGQGQVKYETLSDDDVLAAVHPLMEKYQVIAYPVAVSDLRVDEVKTSNSTMNRTILTLTVRFAHSGDDPSAPASAIDVQVIGEGTDSLGFSASKAQTSAFKLALRQTFLLRTVPAQRANNENGRWAAPAAQRGEEGPRDAQPAQNAPRNELTEFWTAAKDLGWTNEAVLRFAGVPDLRGWKRPALVGLYQRMQGADPEHHAVGARAGQGAPFN